MFDLHGKTALITGSNRGIGRAVLLAYAEHGANLILHCRKPNPAADETIVAAEALGVKCRTVYADMSNISGAKELYDGVKALGLTVDILVLNASVELRRHWTEIIDEEFDLQINTNLRSPMKLMQLFFLKCSGVAGAVSSLWCLTSLLRLLRTALPSIDLLRK